MLHSRFTSSLVVNLFLVFFSLLMTSCQKEIDKPLINTLKKEDVVSNSSVDNTNLASNRSGNTFIALSRDALNQAVLYMAGPLPVPIYSTLGTTGLVLTGVGGTPITNITGICRPIAPLPTSVPASMYMIGVTASNASPLVFRNKVILIALTPSGLIATIIASIPAGLNLSDVEENPNMPGSFFALNSAILGGSPNGVVRFSLPPILGPTNPIISTTLANTGKNLRGLTFSNTGLIVLDPTAITVTIPASRGQIMQLNTTTGAIMPGTLQSYYLPAANAPWILDDLGLGWSNVVNRAVCVNTRVGNLRITSHSFALPAASANFQDNGNFPFLQRTFDFAEF